MNAQIILERPYQASRPFKTCHAVSQHPLKLLAEHPALRSLPECERQALLGWATIRNLRRHETLFRQGNRATSVIGLIDGCLKLSSDYGGREVVLDVLGPGGFAGEVAALNKWPLEADAIALTRCRVLAIDARQFVYAVEHSLDGQVAMMRLVSERLQRATSQVTDALALPASARLAKALLHLASLRRSCGHGDTGPLHLSQAELGAMAGLTRESVNKILGSWRDAGAVSVSGGCVASVDEDALLGLLRDQAGA